MTDTLERRFGSDIEEEWLRSANVDAFLDGLVAKSALNLVGASASALRNSLLRRHPNSSVRAINISRHDAPPTAATDALQIGIELLAESLMPRSSTIVLDPQIGTQIAGQESLIGDIASRTLGSLVLPIFIAPEPYHLFFSDAFSFEEPTGEDGRTDRWCWAVGDSQASVFVKTAMPIAGRLLAFTLSSHYPGTYVCSLGNEMYRFGTNSTKLTRRVEFCAPADELVSRIDISFDGPTFEPTGMLEQRKALRFCFSGFEIENSLSEQALIDTVLPPRPFSFILERLLRRRLHRNGFFEVQTLSSPWAPWAKQAGLRSCFDYQAGFALRDIWNGACDRIKVSTATSYAMPAVWVEARRAPSPGSEWISSEERLFSLNITARLDP